jgi:hypothetical protein
MKPIFADLKEYIATLPVLNSHAHQDLNLDEAGFDLEKLFRNSYVAWCGVTWDDSHDSRRNLLEAIRFNSYFLWTERALQEIYGYAGPLTVDLWDSLSDRIREAHSQPGFWLDLLTRQCRYQGIVQDSYWDPGSANAHPELFTPAFRVNSFFFGYHPEVTDHDGNNALWLYREAEPVDNLEDYLAFVRAKIVEKVAAGCVALKLPIAYDRGLDFENPSCNLAASAFERLKDEPTSADIKVFQDFLFHEVCRIAAELAIPLQVHTGMGRLQRSNALWLLPAIQANPNTRFVLLHCSSPWIQDTIALVRSCPNVYPDLSWLPQLTSSGACRMIHDLIEAGAEHKMCWGCDTWTPEESYGSLLAFRQVLATALAEKVENGYFDLEQAFRIAEQMTAENGRHLYLKRKGT